ncbi:MAG: hypothetical protein Q9220_000512 [cf. Caloplaca sp. 1 TL-2023]
MPPVDLAKANFQDGSYHFGAGRAPWDDPNACHFYNTSQCLKPDCKFNHHPDHRSLRLVLNGPNICKGHLIGEHGCIFTAKGRKCWYSHDLTKAGLPIHDKSTLVEHLTLAEAWFTKTSTYDDFLARIEAEKSWKLGADTEERFTGKMSFLIHRHTAHLLQWYEQRKEAAEKVIEHFKETGTVESASHGIQAAVIDVTGLSGADILRRCGVETPFGRQHQRKLMKKLGSLATEVCDESDGWETEGEESEQVDKKRSGQQGKDGKKKPKAKRSKMHSGKDFDGYDFYGYEDLDSMNPFSESDMLELASQGIKPWDDDAVDALMMLNGGF